MTVSFSLDARDTASTKRSAFYSVTASRSGDQSWSLDEARLVRAMLSKHVVAGCYDDAVRRRVLTRGQAHEEVVPILSAYDEMIARHLSKESE